MGQSRVASRYAKSLIELAESKGQLDEIYADMQLVNDTVQENRDLLLMLDSPIIKGDKKKSILNAIFSGKVSDTSMKFMDILVTKGRERLIDDVAQEVELQFNLIRKVVKAEVVSAAKLADEQRAEVLTLVRKLNSGRQDEVELKETIDPEIIGGFIIRVGDTQLDQSVSGKLEEFRQEFSKNHYIAEV